MTEHSRSGFPPLLLPAIVETLPSRLLLFSRLPSLRRKPFPLRSSAADASTLSPAVTSTSALLPTAGTTSLLLLVVILGREMLKFSPL